MQAWYLEEVIKPALNYSDGVWLDGNGPDNGAWMCSGICCGFGAKNSPHNQEEIDAYCAAQHNVTTTAQSWLIANGSTDV